MHGMMSSFKSDMLTAFSWNNIKRILLPWFGNELSMRWQMYCMSPLSKSRSWALIYIKIPLIEWNVYCVIDNFAEGEKERVHSTFFWSSQSELFSTFVILVYSGFRSGVSIRYYHQRDIQALAGVHSTPLPSVKKAKKKKKSLLFIYIFMKLIKLIECFKILLSGLQVIIFRKHLNKITYWQLCD